MNNEPNIMEIKLRIGSYLIIGKRNLHRRAAVSIVTYTNLSKLHKKKTRFNFQFK